MAMVIAEVNKMMTTTTIITIAARKRRRRSTSIKPTTEITPGIAIVTETGTETATGTAGIAMTTTTGTVPEIGTEMETVEAATKIGKDMMAFAAVNTAIVDAMRAIAISSRTTTAFVMSPGMVTKVPPTRIGAMIGVAGGGQHTRRMRPDMVTKLTLTRTGVIGGGQHPRRV